MTVEEVADDIVAVVQEPGTMGQSNATLIREAGRGLVVDTMLLPEMSQEIAAVAAKLDVRVETVLHSHHHADHFGGNSVFGDARIIAHPQVATDIRQVLGETDLLDRIFPQYAGRFATLGARAPQGVDLAAVDFPGGARPLIFGPAHSFHDVALWFADQRVLLAADLCFNGVTPLAIHGSQPGWAEALASLIALEPEVVVPGHGPIATVQTLADVREYLLRLTATAEAALRSGTEVDEALAGFDPGPVGDWLERGRTRQNLVRGIAEARDRAGYLPGSGPVPRDRAS